MSFPHLRYRPSLGMYWGGLVIASWIAGYWVLRGGIALVEWIGGLF